MFSQPIELNVAGLFGIAEALGYAEVLVSKARGRKEASRHAGGGLLLFSPHLLKASFYPTKAKGLYSS